MTESALFYTGGQYKSGQVIMTHSWRKKWVIMTYFLYLPHSVIPHIFYEHHFLQIFFIKLYLLNSNF